MARPSAAWLGGEFALEDDGLGLTQNKKSSGLPQRWSSAPAAWVAPRNIKTTAMLCLSILPHVFAKIGRTLLSHRGTISATLRIDRDGKQPGHGICYKTILPTSRIVTVLRQKVWGWCRAG